MVQSARVVAPTILGRPGGSPRPRGNFVIGDIERGSGTSSRRPDLAGIPEEAEIGAVKEETIGFGIMIGAIYGSDQHASPQRRPRGSPSGTSNEQVQPPRGEPDLVGILEEAKISARGDDLIREIFR